MILFSYLNLMEFFELIIIVFIFNIYLKKYYSFCKKTNLYNEYNTHYTKK